MSRRRSAGVAVSGLLVTVAVILTIAGDDAGSGPVSAAPPPEARLVTVGELLALEEESGHPVYWVGPPGSDQLEVTEDADGSIYLRYLPDGVALGEQQSDLLTVGTYPVTSAETATRRAAADAGARLVRLPRGGIAFENPDSRENAYFAYPGSDLQVEVYDPKPGRALKLIQSGAVEPVGD